MANIKTDRSSNNSPRRPRGRPREFDREAVLRKAMLLFWESGYEATTLADLRSALGLTQASIYAAFGGKEQLFREAVELYRLTVGNTTARALEGAGSARESLKEVLIEAARTFTDRRNPAGCLVVLGTMNCTRESKAVQDYLHRLRLLTPQAIEARIRRGQLEGDVPKNVRVEAMAAYYTTVLHGLSIQARDGAAKVTLLQVVELTMTAWDTMVSPPSEAKPL